MYIVNETYVLLGFTLHKNNNGDKTDPQKPPQKGVRKKIAHIKTY